MKNKIRDINEVFIELAEKNVRWIVVRYSGGGDSGAIDEVEFFLDDELNKNAGTIVNTPDDENIISPIENTVYKLLDRIEDWYNNEGGYGTVKIKVPTGEYEIQNNIYYTSEESYEHDGKLNLG